MPLPTKKAKPIPVASATTLVRRVLSAYFLDKDEHGHPDSEKTSVVHGKVSKVNYVRVVDRKGKLLALYRVRHPDTDENGEVRYRFKKWEAAQLPEGIKA